LGRVITNNGRDVHNQHNQHLGEGSPEEGVYRREVCHGHSRKGQRGGSLGGKGHRSHCGVEVGNHRAEHELLVEIGRSDHDHHHSIHDEAGFYHDNHHGEDCIHEGHDCHNRHPVGIYHLEEDQERESEPDYRGGYQVESENVSRVK